MPRVTVKKPDYKVKDFSAFIVGKMYSEHIYQKDVAAWLNITQQALSYKLNKGSFTLKETVILLSQLGASDDEIIRAIKL